MYLPKYYEPTPESMLDLIDQHPFATLIADDGSEFQVGHFPLLLDRTRGEKGMLLGHMARANPQWRTFGSREVMAVFHGPHAYITPSWYPDPLNVPTWNYAVAHVFGTPAVLESYDETYEVLNKAVTRFEAPSARPWRLDLPEEYKRELIRGIVGFEIEITRLEGKFKLSQNRLASDQDSIIEGLKTRDDELSQGVLSLMKLMRK